MQSGKCHIRQVVDKSEKLEYRSKFHRKLNTGAAHDLAEALSMSGFTPGYRILEQAVSCEFAPADITDAELLLQHLIHPASPAMDTIHQRLESSELSMFTMLAQSHA